MDRPPLILASRSPRREALLAQLGLRVELRPADVDESPLPGEAPRELVTRLARIKAEAAHSDDPRPLLAADTIVVLEDEVLGKPADRQQALDMLARLSGRSHEVMTAVHLIHGGGVEHALSVSRVRMREIRPAEAARYWDTGEPADKAGAYAIQGGAAVFVSHLEGSHSGVVGLPLYETAQLLERAGLAPWTGEAGG